MGVGERNETEEEDRGEEYLLERQLLRRKSTGEVPAERLAIERTQLQPVPTLYGGRSVRSLQKPVPAPIVGLQHPLSFYDAFAGSLR